MSSSNMSDREEAVVSEKRFILISGAAAFFEDGTTEPLPSFEIARLPVTIGQFDEFTIATGYVTDCEKNESQSFRGNEVVEPFSRARRRDCGVSYVSFRDALAYCDWTGLRLPTEAELLGASLIDWRILSRDERREFLFANSGRFDLSRYPNALANLGAEFVIGRAPLDRAIVRNGPYYVREVDWNLRPQRSEWPADAYSPVVGFRVCRS